MLPYDRCHERFPATVAERFSGFLARSLAYAKTREQPADGRMQQQIGVPNALDRLPRSQMTVCEDRIAFASLKQPVIVTHHASFTVTRRLNPDILRGKVLLKTGERHLESARCVRAHYHLTVLEAGAALGGHQVEVIAHPVQMRPFSPYRIHAIAAPNHGFMVLQRPRAWGDGLRPDLGLTIPLRV